MYDLIVKGGNVVFPEMTQAVDLAVQGGKIAAIGRPGSFSEANKVIDASGCYVLPGGIDPHVHIHWPFLAATTIDTHGIASRAAARGGTTTFIDFAHPKMGPTPLARVSNRMAEVGDGSVLDYSLHCVISSHEPETLQQMEQLVMQGVTSFKMYMTYSRRKIMADDAILYHVMGKAAELGALVMVHAENGTVGDAIEARFVEEGRTMAVDFPQHKPNFIEAEAVERAIFWARQTGARLYFFHLSTREGLELIRAAKRQGASIYAETCPQYLLLDDSVFARQGIGHRFICSPPIRSKQDNEALWEGIQDGTITAIGTDHCAFTIAQKDMGIENFIDVPNGLPGIETRLALMWTEGVEKRGLSPNLLAGLLSTNVARIFGLFPRKGSLAIGSDADLVLFDPSTRWKLTHDQTEMQVDWSPYENWQMKGRATGTIVRGEHVVEDGRHIGSGYGSFIARVTENKH